MMESLSWHPGPATAEPGAPSATRYGGCPFVRSLGGGYECVAGDLPKEVGLWLVEEKCLADERLRSCPWGGAGQGP